MKRREVQRLLRQYAAPQFPEYDVMNDMLATCDGDPILRGLLLSRSQMDPRCVRALVVAQLLVVPKDYLSLGVSKELGDFCFDEPDAEAEVMAQLLARAEGEGRRFLAEVSDCAALAETAMHMPGHKMSRVLGREIRSYCLLWSGREGEATRELDELADDLSGSDDDVHKTILENVTRVARALAGSPDEALALLASWGRQTAAALNLAGCSL